jgi:succinate dehydrogenase / fumarate reductase, cytochrome b subunit
MRERPLSPHLSIYRFRYTLSTSIANRITGVALSGGFVLLVGWLAAAAIGQEAYAIAYRAFAHPAGRIVLALFLIAFVYHALAGIRHLIWDLGYALERGQARVSAWLLAGATLVIAGFLIHLLFLEGAR